MITIEDETTSDTLAAIQYLAELIDSADLDPNHQIEILHQIREMQAILKGLDLDLTAGIYKSGMYGDHDIDGIGRVQITRPPNRTQWDHDDWKAAARHAIFERLGITGDLIDSASGEIIEKYALLEEAMNVAGSTAPKTTELRRLGLSPDEFCHKEQGSPRVTFRSD